MDQQKMFFQGRMFNHCQRKMIFKNKAGDVELILLLPMHFPDNAPSFPLAGGAVLTAGGKVGKCFSQTGTQCFSFKTRNLHWAVLSSSSKSCLAESQLDSLREGIRY